MEKNTYVIEETENYIKTKRIEEKENGTSTNSTILQNKECINLQTNNFHHHS